MDIAARTILETRVLQAINDHAGHCGAVDNVARLLAVIGMLPLIVGVGFSAVCSRDRGARWGSWATLVATLPAAFATWRVDQFLCRPRPFLAHPVRLLLCIPNGVSFPSVEMAIAATLAFGLFAYGGRWRWAPLPYIVLLGLARVFCGIEYPLDQAWAVIIGCTAAVVTILVMNPRHVFLEGSGWPVGAAGAVFVLAAVFLSAHTPEMSLPPPQSTSKAMVPMVVEERSIIRGMSPTTERKIAKALLRLGLPGRIRRVGVGDGEATSVAAVKFDAGTDARPMAREAMEREVLAIVRTALATAPQVSEIDVFGVTAGRQQGRPALTVVYSVAARRHDAGFLLARSAPALTLRQSVARFGPVFYRPHRRLG